MNPKDKQIEWKFISNFPGYEISEFGYIRSWKPERNFAKTPTEPRILKFNIDKDGYRRIALYKDHKRCDIHVHRLVCTVFNRDPKDNEQVRHLDGNKLNNHKTNLVWGTAKDNSLDKILHKTQICGENVSTNKLKTEQVLYIRESNEKPKILSKNYNVSLSLIYKIKSKEIWKSV